MILFGLTIADENSLQVSGIFGLTPVLRKRINEVFLLSV